MTWQYLLGFWRAFFSESSEINGSLGNAHDCPSRTEINGNLRILIEITRKLLKIPFISVRDGQSGAIPKLPFNSGLSEKTARQVTDSPARVRGIPRTMGEGWGNEQF